MPDIEQKKQITGSNSAAFTNINGIVTYVAVSPVGSVNANSTAKVELSSAGLYEIKAATACNVRATLISVPNSNHFTCSRDNTVKITIASADASDKFNVVVHSIRV